MAIKGEDAFKVRSYGRAADSITAGDYDLEAMAKGGRLTEIPNVGRNLEPKIREMVLTGRSSFLERLAEEIPPGLLDLLNVPGIGAKTARLLHDSLGVKNLDDLKAALAEHKVQALPGLGKKREELMAKGLAEIEKYAGRASLGLVLPVMEDLLAALAEAGVRAEAGGELRRYEETVGGLDLVLTLRGSETPAALMERAGLVPAGSRDALEKAWDEAASVFTLKTSFGIPLRAHIAREEDFAARWTYATGPESYIEVLEARARQRGLSLKRDGLFKDDRLVRVRSDKELHEALGMQVVPPEVRHRPEIIEMAAQGELPALVRPEDLRGDLHVHTSWSDGTASVEAMVQKAVSLGYSHIAITDHATEIKMIRTLTPERLEEQVKEIRRVAAAYPQIRVLAGVEVDILKDGRLYLADEVLQGLDIVVASVHQDLSDSRGDLAARLTKAASNPHVDIIGHPIGRLIGRRSGFQAGLDTLFHVAAECGTALEINASPERLDLPEALANRAHHLGCSLAIATDAHSPEGLESLRLGVLASARRAALPPSAIINAGCDPLSRLGRS